ncbi:MAG: glycosyltransferase [Sphingobacteriaceae bacterium]|jgi:glycosyltransferase involved in cell wall biosynthesis|nr:glycosyltransferase [Sphingobacteriaceae bacterium]
MKQIPSSSLLIATYNWPEALEASVRSAFRQTSLPKEIIICDDGSGDATKELVQKLKDESPVPLIYMWHPDEGFQLATIRNKGIALASGDYILQVDGDVILHKDFIKDHLNNAADGVFFSGNRFYLSPDRSSKILSKPFKRMRIYPKLAKDSWAQLRIPFLQKFMADRYRKSYHYVIGCNLGIWRKDLIAINGYDESFTGWGSEDWDLAIRLENSGVGLRLLRFGGIQFHIFHQENQRSNVSENGSRALQHLHDKVTRIEKGVDQYL